MRLWLGQVVSQFGTQITLLALPLIAVQVLDARPFEMGILSATGTLPFLVLSLPAGVLVDRARRRPFLVWGDLGRAAVLLTIPAAFWADLLTIWQLYLVGLAAGIGTVFFEVAYFAYLPSLVEREQLTEGWSKLELGRSASALTGPGIAGILIEVLRAPLAILADAVSFVVSALFVVSIKKDEVPPPRQSRNLRREMGEGLRLILESPILRAIAGCTATSNLFGSATLAVLVLFATRTLEMSPGSIGAAFAVANLGTILGSLSAGRAARAFGLGWAIILGILTAVVSIPLAFATPANGPALLTLAEFGLLFGGAIYNINQVSLRQTITPMRLQGRMTASMRFIVWGVMPIGGLLGGALGEVAGLRSTILIGTVGSSLAFLWVLLSPVRRLKEQPAAVE